MKLTGKVALITNVSHFTAREVIGTKPYQPPEYAMSGHVSEKTDAFALGVVLLELLTALPSSNRETNEFLYQGLSPVLQGGGWLELSAYLRSRRRVRRVRAGPAGCPRGLCDASGAPRPAAALRRAPRPRRS